MRFRYNVSSFQLGYVSEDARANTDIEQYNSGLQECLNFIGMPTSGMFRRGGSKFLARSRTVDRSTQLFVVSLVDENQVILEIGWGLGGTPPIERVIGWLVHLDGVMVEVPLPPITNAHVVGQFICLQQGLDVYLFNPYYPVIKYSLDKNKCALHTFDFLPHGFNYRGRGYMTYEVGETQKIIDGLYAYMLTFHPYTKEDATPDDEFPIYAGDVSTRELPDHDLKNPVERKMFSLTFMQNGQKQIYWGTVAEAFPENNKIEIGLDSKFNPVRNDDDGKTIYRSLPKPAQPCRMISFGVGVFESDEQIGKVDPVRGLPRAATTFDKRLFVGSTKDFPTGIWGSNLGSGTWFNFFVHTGEAADGFQYLVDLKESLDLKWLFGHSRLFIGTGDGIFIGGPAGVMEEALTPANFSVRQIPSVGASDLVPVPSSNGIFYIDRSGTRLQEVVVNEQGRYVANDLSWLGHDLTASGVVSHAWQAHPVPVYWCVCKNGQLVSLTYLPNNGITSWGRHVLGGSGTVNVLNVVALKYKGRVVVGLRTERIKEGVKHYQIELLDNVFDVSRNSSINFNYLDSFEHFSVKRDVSEVSFYSDLNFVTDDRVVAGLIEHGELVSGDVIFVGCLFNGNTPGHINNDWVFGQSAQFMVSRLQTRNGLSNIWLRRRDCEWGSEVGYNGYLNAGQVVVGPGLPRYLNERVEMEILWGRNECRVVSLDMDAIEYGHIQFKLSRSLGEGGVIGIGVIAQNWVRVVQHDVLDGLFLKDVWCQLFQESELSVSLRYWDGESWILLEGDPHVVFSDHDWANDPTMSVAFGSAVLVRRYSEIRGDHRGNYVASEFKCDVTDIGLEKVVKFVNFRDGEFNNRTGVVMGVSNTGLVVKDEVLSYEGGDLEVAWPIEVGHVVWNVTDEPGVQVSFNRITVNTDNVLCGTRGELCVDGRYGGEVDIPDSGIINFGKELLNVTVGYAYKSVLWSLPGVVHGLPIGSMAGVGGSYNYVMLQMYYSNGGWYGNRPGGELAKIDYKTGGGGRFDKFGELNSGVVRVKWASDGSKESRQLYIETEGVYPFNLLGYVHDVSLNDDEMQ